MGWRYLSWAQYGPFSRSVFHGKRVRVNGLFAGNAFQSRQDAAIVVLVALHREAALLVCVGPCQTDKMFLRFCQRHKRTDAERDDCQANCRSYSSVDVLTVADLRNG